MSVDTDNGWWEPRVRMVHQGHLLTLCRRDGSPRLSDWQVEDAVAAFPAERSLDDMARHLAEELRLETVWDTLQ